MLSTTFLYMIVALMFHLSPGLNGSQNSITIDLQKDEAKNIITMLENSTYIITTVNIPFNASVLIFQVHSQTEDLTLSEQPQSSIHSRVIGKNIGLAIRLQGLESKKSMWLTNWSNRKIRILLVISSVDSYGPLPGGCNMEFPTEIAPYLKLRSDSMHNYLEYQHASFGYHRNEPQTKCSLSSPYITYEVYILFLEENNFGEEEYFKKVEFMSSLATIKEHSSKARSYSLHPDTRYSFLMYPNLGVIYNVIAKYTIDNEIKEAVYIPIVSYGCSSMDFTEYGCRIQYSAKGKIFLFALSIYGFLVTFFGYSFVGPNVFFFGTLAFFLVGLILLGKYLTFSKQGTAELSIIVGLLGGTIFLFLWLWLHNVIILLLLNGLVFGFLLTATIFYTPIGNFEIFIDQRNFWALLAVGTMLISALSLALPTSMIVLGSSIVGSYAMLLFYDDFVGTRLSYIVLNIIKRAVSRPDAFASNDYPFQTKDIIMNTVWVLLSLIAVILWSKKLVFTRNSTQSAGQNFLYLPVQSSRSTLLYNSSENDATFQPLLRNGNTTVYRTF